MCKGIEFNNHTKTPNVTSDWVNTLNVEWKILGEITKHGKSEFKPWLADE
jgi:hypothetical protein